MANRIVLKLIKKAGSINQLAWLCGVSRQVVQGWKKYGLPDSAEKINNISKATGTPKKELKPEWYE